MSNAPDPFADYAPSDDPWGDANAAGATPTAPASARPAAAPSEGKIVVTLKGGTGFEQPWIVVHADDPADALAQLNDKTLGELIKRTRAVAGHFHGTGQPAPAAQAAPAQRPQRQAAPAPARQAPSGDAAPSCDHGEMVYRSGSKNGKAWQAYFCPSPKGTPGQCDPEFIR